MEKKNYFLLKYYFKIYCIYFKIFIYLLIINLNNKWGLGIGDWGLGIGDWGLGPIPNPQSPIPINKKINILK